MARVTWLLGAKVSLPVPAIRPLFTTFFTASAYQLPEATSLKALLVSGLGLVGVVGVVGLLGLVEEPPPEPEPPELLSSRPLSGR